MTESADKPGSVSALADAGSHSSRRHLAVALKQPTRVRAGPAQCTPIWPCSEWGLPCPAALAPQAVGSYPTVSPLPRALAGRSAVYFLLHFPSARAAQALPGTLPYGARTFLGGIAPDATALADSVSAQCTRRSSDETEPALSRVRRVTRSMQWPPLQGPLRGWPAPSPSTRVIRPRTAPSAAHR